MTGRVYWRGTWWRIAGGSGEGDAEPAGGEASELSAARARIAELEAEVATAAERAAQAEGLSGRVTELEAVADRVGELEGRLAAADAARLGAERARLLAEHRGTIVEELVRGDTPEALEQSVEAAAAAYGRIAEQVRGQLADAQVPAGGGVRTERAGTEGLSPLQKIAAGLGRNG